MSAIIYKAMIMKVTEIKGNNMQTIIFEDKGQDFTEWVINDGVVVDCQPCQAFVWVGKEVQVNGDTAFIRQGDDAVPVNYRVVSIEDTNGDYLKGFQDAQNSKKDQATYDQKEQYRFGFNVAVSFNNRQTA